MTDAGHFVFFMDDFGTRRTMRDDEPISFKPDLFNFALGGILVPSEAVEEISGRIRALCARWGVPYLHGHPIRGGRGAFHFLNHDPALRTHLMSDIETVILDPRITAHACVICRPGYRDRYALRYPAQSRWALLRSAFEIAVERAAKFARMEGRQLAVVFERAGKTEDRLLRSCFHQLRINGTSFDPRTSSRHRPMTSEDFARTLLSVRDDSKSNPMLQLADLVLHPLCHRTSGLPNRAIQRLIDAGQLIDARNGGDETIAVKYFCYDGPYRLWRA